MQNTRIEVSDRSEIGNFFLKINDISGFSLQNCSFIVLNESFSPIPFIDINLPLPSSNAIF